MAILSKIRDWIKNNMIWENQAEQDFKIEFANNDETEEFIEKCINIYCGNPLWTSKDDEIKTVNFAKTICREVATLSCLNIGITVTGSERADYLQAQVDKITDKLRDWVEFAGASGELILKPNGESIDLYLPTQYKIVNEVGKDITGIIFFNDYYNSVDKKYYSRLEYHRIEKSEKTSKYTITNKCYVGTNQYDFKKAIDIKETAWKDLAEEANVENVDNMLFGILRMPTANNVNMQSNRRLPIFADAIEELMDVDIAYSRFASENEKSKRTVLLDSDRLMGAGTKVIAGSRDSMIKSFGLPKFVKAVEGSGTGDIYHEINPSLNSQMRLVGINALLSQIGFKCGFSNGYFVFNEKSGMITATQVESDDRRTLNTILAVRRQLEACLDDVLYALDKFADAYQLAPRGEYEVAYDMQDLTENHEEDKARWYSYVLQGYIPFWQYLVKFEEMTEDEAKKIAIDPLQMQAQLGLMGEPQ